MHDVTLRNTHITGMKRWHQQSVQPLCCCCSSDVNSPGQQVAELLIEILWRDNINNNYYYNFL